MSRSRVLRQFSCVTIIADKKSIPKSWVCFTSAGMLARSYEPACGAKVVVWNVCQVGLALGDVAVPASLDGVGVVVGNGLALLARIEAEDAACVTLQCLLASGISLGRIGCRVLGLADLCDCAAAVPSIGRVI